MTSVYFNTYRTYNGIANGTLLSNLTLNNSSSNNQSNDSNQSKSIEEEVKEKPPNQNEKGTRSNFPKERKEILIKWLNEHLDNPYPTLSEKEELMRLTGLSMNQIKVWFIDNRRVKLILILHFNNLCDSYLFKLL